MNYPASYQGAIKSLCFAIDLRASLPYIIFSDFSLFIHVNTSSPVLPPHDEYCYRYLCPRCI